MSKNDIDDVNEQEGIIKFNLKFSKEKLVGYNLSEINTWRKVFFALEMIGEKVNRYGGLGFGNLSIKVEGGFLITGSQTGGVERLTVSEYALVSKWELNSNAIVSEGELNPSSESLTHAAVYELDNRIGCVFHIHSPLLWQMANELGMKITDATVKYGTPEMAMEVKCLLKSKHIPNIFSMGGHLDGIVSYGNNCNEAGVLLLETLSKAQNLFLSKERTDN